MRPVIGITCGVEEHAGRFFAGRDYVHSVYLAGGSPVLLPCGYRSGYTAGGRNINGLLDVLDGLLLPGGGDVDPLLFGAEPLPESGEIDPERDWFELEITKNAMARRLPILGICRGMQLLNVAAGGTICQDIKLKVEKPLKHMQQAPRWHPTHTIKVKSKSRAAQVFGDGELRVNSFHHQLVGDLAPGFIVSACSLDGAEEIIECEDPKRHIIGVQFHPENMVKRNLLFLRLFSYLIRHSLQEEKKD